VSQPEDEIIVETDIKVVSIIYLSPEKDKWQFKSGGYEFWANVLDDRFLLKMKDRNLDEIIDLKFSATVKKTIHKKINKKRPIIPQDIYNFMPIQHQCVMNIA
jgi:hypothetical protein